MSLCLQHGPRRTLRAPDEPPIRPNNLLRTDAAPDAASFVRTMTRVQAVILCGGLGTRLAEETDVRPKPMVEIGSRPILWHIMKLYSHFGIMEFILCLGYNGDMIRDYFLNYRAMNTDVRVHIGERRVEHLEPFHAEEKWRVLLAETGLATQTGGRIHRAGKYVDGGELMVTHGDGRAGVDPRPPLAFHRRPGHPGTGPRLA